jgi:hypothetical protein
MLLKLHAFIYRKFGIYTNYARKKEKEYLDSLGILSEFEEIMAKGVWQAQNGFYRTHKQIVKQFKK